MKKTMLFLLAVATSAPLPASAATTSFAKATAVKCATLPSVGKVAEVTGLPTGLTFASVGTYSDEKKKNLTQRGQTIVSNFADLWGQQGLRQA